eukprot:jgi/Chlat1/1606/Chrsp125S01867
MAHCELLPRGALPATAAAAAAGPTIEPRWARRLRHPPPSVSATSVSGRCVWPQEEVEATPEAATYTRRGLLLSSAAGAALASVQPACAAAGTASDVGGLTADGHLRGCGKSTACVSTSAMQSPSQYLPPWTYRGSRASAYGVLKKALLQQQADVLEEQPGQYIRAKVVFGPKPGDMDIVEFLVLDRGVCCFRSVSPVSAPSLPFCLRPGCITGPRNRTRMEALREQLGWLPRETDEEKIWDPWNRPYYLDHIDADGNERPEPLYEH